MIHRKFGLFMVMLLLASANSQAQDVFALDTSDCSLTISSNKNDTIIAFENDVNCRSIEGKVNKSIDGVWMIYSEKDTVLKYQVEYRGGKKNGIEKLYFFRNFLNYQRTYFKGKLHGPYIKYHINGTVDYFGVWKKNKQKWFYLFDEQGNLWCSHEMECPLRPLPK